jgi:uncharacterized membrane protein YkvA (DUF1232 family)
MVRRLAGVLLAAAALLAGGVVLLPTGAADGAGHFARAVVPGTLLAQEVDQPIERRVSGFTKNLVREVRRAFRILRSMFWRVADWWGRWAKMLAFSLSVAVVAALADGGLVNAWRAEGLRTLATYSLLMLYVYARLLFSAGVSLAPKLLLVAALVYGVVRRDVLPDKTFLPGRLDDIVLIVIATRAFVFACPEELVNQYAERAVNLRRRLRDAQRARRQ